MAAAFVDLDGTAFSWGTNTFLKGAYEELRRFYDAGNEIIFVTQRDGHWLRPLNETQNYLAELFPSCRIIFGVTSHRLMLNDAGAAAINHPRDSAWHYDLLKVARKADNGG